MQAHLETEEFKKFPEIESWATSWIAGLNQSRTEESIVWWLDSIAMWHDVCKKGFNEDVAARYISICWNTAISIDEELENYDAE